MALSMAMSSCDVLRLYTEARGLAEKISLNNAVSFEHHKGFLFISSLLRLDQPSLLVVYGQHFKPCYCLRLSSPVFPVFLHTNKVPSCILM